MKEKTKSIYGESGFGMGMGASPRKHKCTICGDKQLHGCEFCRYDENKPEIK